MARKYSKTLLILAILIVSLGATCVKAAVDYLGIIGKDGWLYYNHEITTVANISTINIELDMIKRFNKVLSANGVTMAEIIIPTKMRVYPEFLPPTVKVSSQMTEEYNRIMQALRVGQVNTIDLNAPMMSAANKSKYAPYPLFLKLDRHWSPSGALIGADAVKAEIEANPALKKAYDATPSQTCTLEISKEKKRQNSHDLVGQLSPQEQASHTFPAESSLLIKTVQVTPSNKPIGSSSPFIKTVQATPGNNPSGVVVLGDSNSQEWTGFPDALRYALQRDIAFSTAIGAIGPWYGAITYFSEESVQSKLPKLLLWETTERELHMAPDTTFREARYRINPTEWLLRVSALIQQNCKASSVTGKIAPTGIAAKPGAQKADGVGVTSTADADFMDIEFNNPVTKLDYLSAQLLAAGVRTITLEASGPDTPQQKITVEVKGDNTVHALKYPLISLTGKGYTKVRIYPGTTSGFSFQGLKVCRQPEDILS